MDNKLKLLELQDKDFQYIQKQFGKKIKLARVNKELSLKEVYQISGISENHLSRLENGKYVSPSLKMYLKVCYAVNLNPLKLFEDINKYPPFSDDDYFFID